MDGGAWKAAVHGVAEGQTRLSDFPFTFHFHALVLFLPRVPGPTLALAPLSGEAVNCSQPLL